MAPIRLVTPRSLFLGIEQEPEVPREPYVHPSKLAWPEIPHNPQRVTEPLRFPSPIDGQDTEAALSSIPGPQPITLVQAVLRFFGFLPKWTTRDPLDYPSIPYPPYESILPVGEPDRSDDEDLDEMRAVENLLVDQSSATPSQTPTDPTPSHPTRPTYKRRDNSPFFPADDRVPEVWGPDDEWVEMKVATGVANNYTMQRIRISTRTDREYIASLRGKRLCIFRIRGADMPYFHRVLALERLSSWWLKKPPLWRFDPQRSSCWEGTNDLKADGTPRPDPHEAWMLVGRDNLHVRKTSQLNDNRMPAGYVDLSRVVLRRQVIITKHVVTFPPTTIPMLLCFAFMVYLVLNMRIPHPSAYAWPLDHA